MPKFELDSDQQLTYGDKDRGAVFNPSDEHWYPFAYFNDGNLDIWDTEGGYLKPSIAYTMAKLKFT